MWCKYSLRLNFCWNIIFHFYFWKIFITFIIGLKKLLLRQKNCLFFDTYLFTSKFVWKWHFQRRLLLNDIEIIIRKLMFHWNWSFIVIWESYYWIMLKHLNFWIKKQLIFILFFKIIFNFQLHNLMEFKINI